MKLIELLGTRCEVQAQRKDKSFFPIELALSRVDHLGLYTGILRDVTVQKQLQSHVLQIATDEQMRIGQELHDGTQQELTGLSLFAGAINDLLDKANAIPESHDSTWQLRDVDYQRIRRSLEKLTQGLIEANQHVHKLSHGIMPIQIEADGLKSALAHLASTTNDNHKIQCHFSSKGEGTIRSSAVATQLYRIAQESLTNSIKHGKASDIQIVLKDSMDRIVLEISDNGIGFDPEGLTGESLDGDGQGLRIMRYRTSILGGELLVKLNERNGTTVRCSIPNQRGLT
jgi:signal transduction histidine kinase